MLKAIVRLSLVAAVLVLFTGCETVTVKEPGPEGGAGVEERRTPAEGEETLEGEGIRTHGMPGTPGFRGHPLDDPASAISTRIIYFDFDRSEIKPEFRPAIEAHAGYLAENPGASLTLEGHTDERGSREYNLGLGERRAMAVRRLMLLLGASDDQIRAVSYGEESPAEEGHDESAWQFNRRVELIYLGR